MLKIKCSQCNAILKGVDIVVTTFDHYEHNIKYKDYAVTCPHCGGSIVWDRYVQKAEENKAKAVAKMAKKKGKSVEQIASPNQYEVIMRGVFNRAKELGTSYKKNNIVGKRDFYKAFNELPQDQRDVVLEYEDQEHMKLLNKKPDKPSEQISEHSMLLLTQSIINLAILDKDEEFFKSNYGKQIVAMYNAALTIYKKHDFNITAELLLEKMQKGKIKL